ncbi:unnamed protein product [Haemonchus placei]|uniref:Transposon MuDR mudrA n=1 Tax=Haemonchus placei TaxID=6290 RepID=A0A0N4W6T9_HAEPC|nr:unnamed protein product [Haemonchus placei]
MISDNQFIHQGMTDSEDLPAQKRKVYISRSGTDYKYAKDLIPITHDSMNKRLCVERKVKEAPTDDEYIEENKGEEEEMGYADRNPEIQKGIVLSKARIEST